MKPVLTIGSLCLLLFACAEPAKREFLELPSPPLKLKFHGFSLLPLDQPNWLLVQNTENRLDLAKPGLQQDETYTIQLWLLKLPPLNHDAEFLRYIKQGLDIDNRHSRFQVIKNQWQTANRASLRCVRFDKTIIDSEPKRSSKRQEPMFLEITGLSCRHPKLKNHAVQMAYSHRHYKENSDRNFLSNANKLLHNIAFVTDKQNLDSAYE